MVRLSTNIWNRPEENLGRGDPRLLDLLFSFCFLLPVLTCMICCYNSSLSTSKKLIS